jgi:hypothetical protein
LIASNDEVVFQLTETDFELSRLKTEKEALEKRLKGEKKVLEEKLQVKSRPFILIVGKGFPAHSIEKRKAVVGGQID